MNIDTIIIDSEETSRSLIKTYLSAINEISVVSEFDDVFTGYNYILENRPQLAIIDISEKTQVALDLITKLTTNQKNIKVIVVSYDMSSETIIKALRAGAREFQVKPLIEADFISSVSKIKELIAGNINDANKCKVITTFSNKGGIGKTAIATNLAVELANITKERVALIDLNLQMGDVTTFLDLNPAFNTSYVIENLERIDETFLLSTLEKYKNLSLFVLADPPDLEQAEIITSEEIAALINVLKSTFSYIVIDTTSSFDGKTITALDCSDLILLIAIVNLPSIRNCQRCLDLFKRLGYEDDKIKFVINRYMENDEIKIEDVEEVLAHSVYYKIPNNYYTMMNAINKGLPVSDVNPNSNVAQSFKELAAMLSDSYTYQEASKTPVRENSFSLLNLFKKKENK